MEHTPHTPLDAIRDSGLSEEKPQPAPTREVPELEEQDSGVEAIFPPELTGLQRVDGTDPSTQDSVRKPINPQDWDAIMNEVDDRFADKGRAGV